MILRKGLIKVLNSLDNRPQKHFESLRFDHLTYGLNLLHQRHLENIYYRSHQTKEGFYNKTTYYLLKRSPGVLNIVECGFLTNPEEAATHSSEEYQEKVAQAIAITSSTPMTFSRRRDGSVRTRALHGCSPSIAAVSMSLCLSASR